MLRLKKFLIYFTRQPKILVFILLLIDLLFLNIYIIQTTRDRNSSVRAFSKSNEKTTNGSLPNTQDFTKENNGKSPQKIVETTFVYDANTTPVLSLDKIKIKNGFYPKPPRDFENEMYTLELIDADETIAYSREFVIPNKITALPPEPGKSKDASESSIVLTKMSFAVTVPLIETTKSIRLVSPSGDILQVEDLKNADAVNNQPNYHSIPGDQIKPKKQSFLNSLIGDIYATTTDSEYVDITFIGDNYLTATDLDRFHTDINNFISNMLTYAPFGPRSSQLLFHFVDNTSDLGCYYSGRLIICNDAMITQTVNNSGVPYDKIFVIMNNSTYGGAGGDISTAYNGSWGSQVFVHEFAHSFALLVDEYLANYPYGRLDRNCYHGTPPNPLWEGVVSSSDYYLECNYSSWYRSSANSIMRAIDSYSFNAISQKHLNDYIDYYAGSLVSPTITPTPTIIIPTEVPTPVPTDTPSPVPTQTLTPTPETSTTPIPTPIPTDTPIPTVTPTIDPIPPSIAMTYPGENETIANIISIQVTANDNIGVTQVTYRIDGTLIDTVIQPPFNLAWDTRQYTNDFHTIVATAFDAAGNNTVVSRTVTVDNSLPNISFTNPQDGARVRQKSKVKMSVSASDTNGIAKVEMFVNNNLLCTDTTTPYSCTWNVPTGNGVSYKLTAKAYDKLNTSNSLTITVTSK